MSFAFSKYATNISVLDEYESEEIVFVATTQLPKVEHLLERYMDC
jgi:hypothetical protein